MATSPTPPSRRKADQHWWSKLVRENWYRDVWLLVITILVVIAVVETRNNVDDVQNGRQLTLRVFCASTSAVIDAGRSVIGGSAATLPPELQKNLQKLGYPPPSVQKAQSKAAADLYAKSISIRVQRETGVRGLVRKDGTLDCTRIVHLGKTGKPR